MKKYISEHRRLDSNGIPYTETMILTEEEVDSLVEGMFPHWKKRMYMVFSEEIADNYSLEDCKESYLKRNQLKLLEE